jgi:hypothetical protein
VFVIHGAEISPSAILEGQSGRGLDDDIKAMADTASRALHALNPKDRVLNVDWASLGDTQTPAAGIALRLHQILAQEPGPHDVMVLAFSRGGYVADAFVKQAAANEPTVRRFETVFLDPTGLKLGPLNDGSINAMQNHRVNNITYHDGLHPYAKWLVNDEYPMAGTSILVQPLGHPTSDGTKSHNAFPTWYVQNRELDDILSFEQATPGESHAARSAAISRSPSFVEIYNAPGHGTNLLIPLIEAALVHGIDTLIDDAGHIIKVVASKPGEFVVSIVNDVGHTIESVVNGAGHVISTVDKGIKDILGDLFGWL